VAQIPAIVSQEVFAQVKAKLAHNQSFALRNNTAHKYLLRALVTCGVCQLSCTGRQLAGGYQYYVCQGKNSRVYCHLEQRCSARFFPTDQLDELVWQDLCEVLAHPEMITAALERAQTGGWMPQELQARRDNLRKGQNALQSQLDRLTEAYLNGVIPLPEYQRRRSELEKRQQGLAEQEKQLVNQVHKQEELAGWNASIAAFCQRVQTGLKQATFDQKRKLVELLIDRVIVTEENVEIRYVIPISPESEHSRFCHLRKDYFDLPAAVVAQDDAPGIIGGANGLIGNQIPGFATFARARDHQGKREMGKIGDTDGQENNPGLALTTAAGIIDHAVIERTFPA
jgi:site-specific DNA recombinase